MDSSSLKLVLAGPVGAGKSTAIRALADDEPVSTEMPMSEGAIGDKTTTTVALDFATVQLDDGQPLLVYGLPGQAYFAHMRAIVLDGAVGALLLLNGRDPDVAGACREWLRSLRELEPDLAIVIGITHTEHLESFDTRAVQAVARSMGPPIPIFTFDARDRDQTAHLVRALLLAMV